MTSRRLGNVRMLESKLRRITNAMTARLVSGTRKYDRGLSRILHADLHWLDVADGVRYKLAVTVHRCLYNKAPRYLADCCVVVSARHIVASWTCHVITAVHSAVVHFLSPDQSSGSERETTWKTVVLGSHWKHCFSVSTSVLSALEVYLYTTMSYINRRFTYLLTQEWHFGDVLQSDRSTMLIFAVTDLRVCGCRP